MPFVYRIGGNEMPKIQSVILNPLEFYASYRIGERIGAAPLRKNLICLCEDFCKCEYHEDSRPIITDIKLTDSYEIEVYANNQIYKVFSSIPYSLEYAIEVK